MSRLEQVKKDIALLEAEKERLESRIPIISWADFENPKDRIIIRLTKDMIKRIKDGAKVISVEKRGYVWGGDRRADYDFDCYKNITPIFGEFNAK